MEAASESTAEGRDPSALYCQDGSIRSVGVKGVWVKFCEGLYSMVMMLREQVLA